MQLCLPLICVERFLYCLGAIATLQGLPAHAQDQPSYDEQNKLIRAPQAYTRLGADIFGDKVNLYTGSLEFVQNDVALPGNNVLPVVVGRRMVTGTDAINGALFGQWDGPQAGILFQTISPPTR